ncbi:hypothetical protein PAXRUDRAFT_17233 [Paxillus rubicundulus Ve08.2h10]|uniref:Unplaced genomic scaffold scaffold_1991, whole genome shotgun sequence n=1 Tax=Paxillus rubicundulus Ve08.2h10 TaxID=930991 RepID=A0A0D0DIE1_9AGAM|nr:hypothetical protein PAXRUDRAFT_17233 [Paxillus rubicundulus Ve08.2h10]
MGEPERTLRNRLEEWRELQMVEEDLKGDDFFGSQIIMSNGVLNRIIDLAHGHKISDVASLLAQTDWVYSELYGPKILEIVQATIPTPSLAQPPVTRNPQSQVLQEQPQNTTVGQSSTDLPEPQAVTATHVAPPLKQKCVAYKCGSCGGVGHNASNKLCPNYIAKPKQTRRPNTENLPPSPVPCKLNGKILRFYSICTHHRDPLHYLVGNGM